MKPVLTEAYRMAVTEKDVRDALKSVKDPELGLDLDSDFLQETSRQYAAGANDDTLVRQDNRLAIDIDHD